MSDETAGAAASAGGEGEQRPKRKTWNPKRTLSAAEWFRELGILMMLPAIVGGIVVIASGGPIAIVLGVMTILAGFALVGTFVFYSHALRALVAIHDEILFSRGDE